MNILDDLKLSVTKMTVNEITVPRNYAELVYAELLQRGVRLEKFPEVGDEMHLQFTTGSQLTLHVH